MLEINNLNIQFKTNTGFFEAVKNISFKIDKGKVLGIVGESGSGKSVTALAIMQLLNASSTNITGSILLDNTNLINIPEKQMQALRGNRLGMIFQEPMTSLNPVLTCGYQVAEAIRLHKGLNTKVSRQLTIDLFNEVQLPRAEALFDTYPHQISGGQKQRIMIAMALSCDPEILIADEPTTALDVTVQKNIIDLLIKLKTERKMSLIFISHDLGVINEIADDVIVMYKGEIVEKATVKNIFNNPLHAYTRGLLACRPSPSYQLSQLPVISDFLKFDTAGGMQDSGVSIADIRDRFIYKKEDIRERKKQLYIQQPLLKVRNLCTWYPINSGLFQNNTQFIKAIDNISFDVYPGETLGLVGESGSGKTTLGRSILRLIEPTSGHVIFKNTNVQHLKNEELRAIRQNMQIIFQDPYSSLNPRITVGESIMEPLIVHHLFGNNAQRKKRVMELLDKVNLSSRHFYKYPHECSGGQRQRIVIARALALQPQFIICDESVSALDVSVQAQILNLLRDLQTEFKLTYLFISHNLAVVKHIADRIMVLNSGIIEEIGDSEQIYHNPQKLYTQNLIASITI